MTRRQWRTPWPQIWLLYLAGIAAAAQIGVYGPIAPTVRALYGASFAEVAFAVSLITGVGALTAVWSGWAAQYFGLLRSVRYGLLAMLVACLLIIIVDRLIGLYAGRLLAGIGYMFVVTACPALMNILSADADRDRAMALWSTFYPVGFSVGVLAGNAFVEPTSIAVSLLASLSPGVVALVALGSVKAPTLTPKSLGDERRQKLSDDVQAIAKPHIIFRCMQFGLFTGGSSILIISAPELYSIAAGLAIHTVADLIGGLAFIGVSGVGLAVWARRRRISHDRIIGASLAVLVITIWLAWRADGPVELSAMLLLVFLALNSLAAGVFGGVTRLVDDPRRFGVLQGMITQCAEIGVLVLPVTIAHARELFGWQGLLAGTSMAYILSGLALLLARRYDPPGLRSR